jgi:mannose-1-phosphate guanylyltransferase
LSGRFSKAFLLAAGLGTRLRPLTDRLPKCLVPIHGKPLLSLWVEICENLGVQEVLINTHHLAEEVQNWARRQDTRIRIHLVHENNLLGSAGTVAANREFVSDDDDFYVFYADNLVRADLAALAPFHARHEGVLTLGLFRSPKPQDCGIVTLDDAGRITSFEEKPPQPRSNLANAGIFAARRSLFDFLPYGGFADFGKDVMPRLVEKMWGYLLKGYVLDVGTPESYQRALKEWPGASLGGIKDGLNF